MVIFRKHFTGIEKLEIDIFMDLRDRGILRGERRNRVSQHFFISTGNKEMCNQ